MTKPSIAFTELAEKGPDVDLVRDMLQLAAKAHGTGCRSTLAPPTANEPTFVRTLATAIATGLGKRAPAQSTYAFQSCVGVRISPAFSSHGAPQKKR